MANTLPGNLSDILREPGFRIGAADGPRKKARGQDDGPDPAPVLPSPL